MNLLKTFKFTWWQAGFFKVGMLATGIAIGAYWHDFAGSYLPVLIVVAILTLAYATYVWARQ